MTAQAIETTVRTYRRQDWRVRKIAERSLYVLLLFVIALFFIYPVVWLTSASLRARGDIYRAPLHLIPDPISLKGYVDIFRSTPVHRFIVNSVIYGVGGATISLALGLVVAYGVSRHYFKGKRPFLIGLLLVQLVPGLVRIVPTLIMMQTFHLTNSRIGLVILYGTTGIAGTAWVLKGYVDSVPIEIDESAWIDGASKFRTIWQMILPAVIPGMATLFILGFIGCWMDFVTPAVLLKDANLFSMTAATRMVHDVDASDFQLLTAWCMLNIVPVLFMFMLVQRYLVSGLTAGALK